MTKLFIVESPNKVKKLQSFLGSSFKVAASVGHVRDLPVKSMGVEPPDFKPYYEATERGQEVLKKLASMVKQAEPEVYLATDPDREGEAIAWHLASSLHLKNPVRVTFHEITQQAVSAALGAPRKIDMKMVAAQEARRVLDRFCGYMVSPALSDAVGQRLSAGRVQSVALRLVVDREGERRAFVSTTHFGVELVFDGEGSVWRAEWLIKPWLSGEEKYMLDEKLAQRVAQTRQVEAVKFDEKESRQAPPAPFTTAALQKAANARLKFGAKKCMGLAQTLYEQGHITYIRTDSPNLCEEATAAVRAFCQAQGWPLSDKIRRWKAKEGAQEGHECIRPTHIETENCGETPDEQALYRLIRNQTLASQLADAVSSVRSLILKAADTIEGKEVLFEAKGSKLVSPGFRILLGDDDGKSPQNPVPAAKLNQSFTAGTGKVLTKKTQPPARYSEGSLIEALEKMGIGRPSTYASIIGTLFNRNYIETEKGNLLPLPSGETVVERLKGHFKFMEYDFTRHMEDALDDIAEGKNSYRSVVSNTYEIIAREVHAFSAVNPKIERKSNSIPCDIPCPSCKKGNLTHLAGTSAKGPYDFFKCPFCGNSFPNQEGQPGPGKVKPELSKYKCPKCKKPLVRHQGQRKDGQGDYDFYTCSGFPSCKEKYQTSPDGSPEISQNKEKRGKK